MMSPAGHTLLQFVCDNSYLHCLCSISHLLFFIVEQLLLLESCQSSVISHSTLVCPSCGWLCSVLVVICSPSLSSSPLCSWHSYSLPFLFTAVRCLIIPSGSWHWCLVCAVCLVISITMACSWFIIQLPQSFVIIFISYNSICFHFFPYPLFSCCCLMYNSTSLRLPSLLSSFWFVTLRFYLIFPTLLTFCF